MRPLCGSRDTVGKPKVYLHRVSAAMAKGKRPVPFRTRKLSLSAPMVLHSRGCGRVGRCRTFFRDSRPEGRLSRKNVRQRPTLPHPRECSTIGAERLSFRVRNGTGRFPFAMAAETLWRYTFGFPTVSREPHSGRIAK